MERFCNKCGQLVNGDGVFCPNCGGKLDGAVDLGKPASSVSDVMPTVSTNATNTFGTTGTTNSTYSPANTTNSTYQGQMPSYSQPIQPINTQPDMTVGQWVLTIFLSGLGIIGIILLFVWAFGSDTNTSKKNYARAMLIWQAIAIGLVVIFYIALFACVGAAAGGLEGFFEEMENAGYYAAISNMFIR